MTYKIAPAPLTARGGGRERVGAPADIRRDERPPSPAAPAPRPLPALRGPVQTLVAGTPRPATNPLHRHPLAGRRNQPLSATPTQGSAPADRSGTRLPARHLVPDHQHAGGEA